MNFIVKSVEETMSLGLRLGKLLGSGDVLCIIGDLGAGKTHFVKGLAKGLDIKDNITSPTFTLVNEYQGRLKLYHFDVYRIDDCDELNAIGFDEYIFSDAVSIIEWANIIEDLIPTENIKITLNKLPKLGDDFRQIEINYTGERYNYVKELNLC